MLLLLLLLCFAAVFAGATESTLRFWDAITSSQVAGATAPYTLNTSSDNPHTGDYTHLLHGGVAGCQLQWSPAASMLRTPTTVIYYLCYLLIIYLLFIHLCI
jgi:hypothetical protein